MYELLHCFRRCAFDDFDRNEIKYHSHPHRHCFQWHARVAGTWNHWLADIFATTASRLFLKRQERHCSWYCRCRCYWIGLCWLRQWIQWFWSYPPCIVSVECNNCWVDTVVDLVANHRCQTIDGDARLLNYKHDPFYRNFRSIHPPLTSPKNMVANGCWKLRSTQENNRKEFVPARRPPCLKSSIRNLWSAWLLTTALKNKRRNVLRGN